LTSLFALAWPGQVAHPTASPPVRASAAATTVPDVTLVNPSGGVVHLRNTLPAVLLLQDGCACGDLDLATAQAVPAGVTVLAVGRIAPVLPSSALVGLRLLALADPDGRLRTTYAAAPTETGVLAVLIRRSGEVVRAVHAVTGIADFEADLAKLG